jgi:mannosyl-oligosaccharide alpha-1,2-mannosidase
MLLGGQSQSYKDMYEKFIVVAQKELFFRPMTVGEDDILISGAVTKAPGKDGTHNPEVQHLACFVGGMVAIAGKIFNRPDDIKDGARLADGCVWAYRNTISGIMPETFTAVPCKSRQTCPWDSRAWFNAIDISGDEGTVRDRVSYSKLSPGMQSIQDGRYLLR